ncbi:MAG: hypothetical protein P8M08_06720 [Akkermansiaceae bacterium]|nr:hypothetical protein [Akkermansiaceae bacterium]
MILCRGVFHSLIGVKSADRATIVTLFGPEPNPIAAPDDAFYWARTMRRSFGLIMSGNKKVPSREGGHAKTVIFASHNRPERKQMYVAALSGDDDADFVRLDQVPNGLTWFERFPLVLVVLSWGAIVFPLAFLRRNRSAFSRILETVEAVCLCSYVHQKQASRFYFFSAFVRNANLISLLLSRYVGVHVTKVPSANPLVHYKYCVCDEVILTASFQVPQYHQFRENWYVPTVRIWRPLGHVTFPSSSYRKAPGDKRTVGLLSSGQWWRKERGDAFDEQRAKMLKAESDLHHALHEYLQKNSGGRVILYPHPSEKVNAETYSRAVEVYSERIGDSRLEIVKPDERTHDRFDESDTFVSLWSTSAVEALYCGQKVILARLGCPAAVESKALENISVSDVAGLQRMLDECLSLSADEFFDRFGLQQFRHDYFGDTPTPVD